MTSYVYSFDGADTALGATIPVPSTHPALVAYSGSWQQLGNRAVTSTPSASNPMLGVDLGGGGNFDVQARVSAQGGDAVYGRWSDSSNWFRARIRSWQTTSSYYVPPVTETVYMWSQRYLWDFNVADPHTHVQTAEGTATGAPYFAPTWYHVHEVWDEGRLVSSTYGHTMSASGAPYISSTYQRTVSGGYTQTVAQTNYEVILEKCVAGVISVLKRASIASNSYLLRLRGVATQVQVFVNGSATPLFTHLDDHNRTATKMGLGRGSSELSGSALDDLRVDNLNTPPNAPVLVSGTGGQIMARGDVNRFTHVHSDPDGDGQVRYEREWRIAGGTWTGGGYRQTTNQFYDEPANFFPSVGQYERRVRTFDGVSWGPYAVGTFTIVERPEGVTFVSPVNGSIITSSRQDFVLSATDYDTIVMDASKEDGTLINQTSPANRLTFTWVNLTNGQTYVFGAWAIKNGLVGPKTTITLTVEFTPPPVAAPTLRRYLVGGEPVGITVLPNHPAPTGSQPSVAKYDVEREAYVRGAWVGGILVHGQGINPTTPFDDLTVEKASAYRYRVRAIGSNGSVSVSDWVDAFEDALVPDAQVPGVPALSVSGITNTTAVAAWVQPLDDGGSPIAFYRLGWIELGGENRTWFGTYQDSDSPVTLTGLAPGISYSVWVEAVNSVGPGARAETSITTTGGVVTGPTVPAAPGNITTSATSDTVTVSWTEPSDGGSLITGYRISRNGVDQTGEAGQNIVLLGATVRSFTFTNLVAATAYQFTIYAMNAVGDGTAATVSRTTAATATAIVPLSTLPVQSAKATTATLTGTSLSVSLPAPPTAGRLLTVHLAVNNNGGTFQMGGATSGLGGYPSVYGERATDIGYPSVYGAQQASTVDTSWSQLSSYDGANTSGNLFWKVSNGTEQTITASWTVPEGAVLVYVEWPVYNAEVVAQHTLPTPEDDVARGALGPQGWLSSSSAGHFVVSHAAVDTLTSGTIGWTGHNERVEQLGTTANGGIALSVAASQVPATGDLYVSASWPVIDQAHIQGGRWTGTPTAAAPPPAPVPVSTSRASTWRTLARVTGGYPVGYPASYPQHGITREATWAVAAASAGPTITGTDLGDAAVGMSTNAVLTLTNAVPAGSTIVVATVNATTTAPTVTDSAGNTYTQRTMAANGSNHSTRIFTARAASLLPAGATITVTPGRADVGTAMSASAWQGITATSPVDATTSVDGGAVTSTTPSAGPVAASTQPQLLFAAFGNTSPDRTHTPAAGWTFLQKTSIPSDFIRALQTQYRIVTATGSYTASGTLDTATTWSAAAVGLKGT